MIQLRLDASPAHVRLSVRAPEAWVCCWGEIDDGSIRWLELPLSLAVELGAERVEVDLRGVSFLDGAVMKALCRASRAFPLGSGALRVWVQPRIEALFRRVRLDQLMTIEASGDEERVGMQRRLPPPGAPPAGG